VVGRDRWARRKRPNYPSVGNDLWHNPKSMLFFSDRRDSLTMLIGEVKQL